MNEECSLWVLITNLTRLKPFYDKPSSSEHPLDVREMRDDDKDTVDYLSGPSVDTVSMGT